MVIDKNPGLLKEIQNIISVNNINMNIADMLMNVFSYTDIIDPNEVNQYIKEGWSENEAILNILYDYLGLDKDNEDNQEVMEKYVLNTLKRLNPNDYLNNLYVKAIKDSGKNKKYALNYINYYLCMNKNVQISNKSKIIIMKIMKKKMKMKTKIYK